LLPLCVCVGYMASCLVGLRSVVLFCLSIWVLVICIILPVTEVGLGLLDLGLFFCFEFVMRLLCLACCLFCNVAFVVVT